MNGQHRLHIGVGHEQAVRDALTARGWFVQEWGQGVLDARVRQALNDRSPIVLWRWLPDLIAIKGQRVVLVDPKTDINKSTPNFSIEISAIQAHCGMRFLGLRIVYVFEDMTCNTPENLEPVKWWMPDPGRDRVAAGGSGTPFALVRKSDQVPLDTWFGSPAHSVAAE